jgi:hypothetical protein
VEVTGGRLATSPFRWSIFLRNSSIFSWVDVDVGLDGSS